MSADRHVLEITPSRGELRQLLADLQVLRERGAISNTSAIVDAVHEAAVADYSQQDDEKRPGSARDAPGPAQEV